MFRKSLSGDPTSPRAALPGRATWSGLLQLSLVAIPIKAYPATTSSHRPPFRQLHADCGQPIRYHKCCPAHGELDAADIVKGFEFARDQFVVIDDMQLDQMRPPQERSLLLEQFIDPQEVQAVQLSGRSLYLAPDGPPATRSYAVLYAAMRERGKWALGRVVMNGRRLAVTIEPAMEQLTMHVLHDPASVRAAPPGYDLSSQTATGHEELQLAGSLIDAVSGSPDWSRYRDDTPDKIRQLLDTKLAGRPVVTPTAEPLQVRQLLDALQASVAKTQPKGKSPPARKPKAKRRSA